jgi:ABC-2 type transport system ATP-binding protein
MKKLISLIDITKTYTTRGAVVDALKGINATLYDKTITCLVGVNGAGKTTLSSLIASLHPATSGDIQLGDFSIYENIVAYRRRLGYVPQHLYFDDAHHVENQLLIAAQQYGITGKAALDRCDELIELLELAQFRYRYPSQLSGGYRQKLGIARALVHAPSILVLDEPTVGLDPHARRQVIRTLARLRNLGTTILLTTHYLDEVEELADNVLFIDSGRIIREGRPSELLAGTSAKNLEELFIQLIESTPR